MRSQFLSGVMLSLLLIPFSIGYAFSEFSGGYNQSNPVRSPTPSSNSNVLSPNEFSQQLNAMSQRAKNNMDAQAAAQAQAVMPKAQPAPPPAMSSAPPAMPMLPQQQPTVQSMPPSAPTPPTTTAPSQVNPNQPNTPANANQGKTAPTTPPPYSGFGFSNGNGTSNDTSSTGGQSGGWNINY